MDELHGQQRPRQHVGYTLAAIACGHTADNGTALQSLHSGTGDPDRKALVHVVPLLGNLKPINDARTADVTHAVKRCRCREMSGCRNQRSTRRLSFAALAMQATLQTRRVNLCYRGLTNRCAARKRGQE